MLDQRLSFSPALQKLYTSKTATGRSGTPVKATGGLSTINNLLAIKRLLDRHKPKNTLEIGLACGGSALLFATYHQERNSPPRSHTAIDAYQHDYDFAAICELENASLASHVDHVNELSQVALPRMWDEDRSVDFVYIDGSHEFADVFVDFYFVDKLLTPDGLVLFDDCSNPKVSAVTKLVRTAYREQYRVVPRSLYRPTDRTWFVDCVAEKVNRVQLRAFQKTDYKPDTFFDFENRGRRTAGRS